MTIDLTEIILAVITLLSGIAMRYLVPLLKEKLDSGKRESMAALIDVGVYAAEQLLGSGKGQEKKAYVQTLLINHGYNVKLAEVDAAIEAAVQGLKIAIK